MDFLFSPRVHFTLILLMSVEACGRVVGVFIDCGASVCPGISSGRAIDKIEECFNSWSSYQLSFLDVRKWSVLSITVSQTWQVACVAYCFLAALGAAIARLHVDNGTGQSFAGSVDTEGNCCGALTQRRPLAGPCEVLSKLFTPFQIICPIPVSRISMFCAVEC